MSHGNAVNIWCSAEVCCFTLNIFPVREITASAIHVDWLKHLPPWHFICYKRDCAQKMGMRLAITTVIFVTHCALFL